MHADRQPQTVNIPAAQLAAKFKGKREIYQ